MKINRFTLAREELVSDTFALPYGRRVVAEFEMTATVLAGSTSKERDSLQLIVESRASKDEPFTVLAQTPVISASGIVSVELPVIETPEVDPSAASPTNPYGGLPPPCPSGRVRVVHNGRLMPRFEVRLVGL